MCLNITKAQSDACPNVHTIHIQYLIDTLFSKDFCNVWR